jgi:hypothetical protein
MKRVFAAITVLTLLAGTAGAGQKSAPPRFRPNPRLAGMAEMTAAVVSEGYRGDHNVLDYSGMIYDRHRHRMLAFGGGHATRRFPSSVHEFDPSTLKWSELIESVPPSEYTRKNAVLDAAGKPLGGVKYKGRIQASSRHTYDGLVVLPNEDRMICVQRVGEIGGSYLDGKVYRECYKGTGMWIFDPVKREWSVSRKSGLALNHVGAAVWPQEPDWIYFYSQRMEFRAVNWKTEEVRKLPRPARGMGSSYAGLQYWPEGEAMVAFPRGTKAAPANKYMCTFDLKTRTWSRAEVKGEAPNTYDINAVYDSRCRVFVCFQGEHFHYFVPATKTWHKVKAEAARVVGVRGVRHRHAYDPVNNVHLIVGRRWKTVAFKLAEKPESLLAAAK